MQDQPSKSFVARFEALAGTSTKRRVDLELRILDVVFALAFGLLVLPLALLIAAVVAATSGLPVLYRGERVRRTDLEYTRVGRAVKATQLDELPQFWNVLRGDMSFVGPRPIRPRFFEQLASELPAYWQRLVVRPGLSGFAQVRHGYETPMAEKLAHDLEWIADRSVRLYLRTLFATVWRVVGQTLRMP